MDNYEKALELHKKSRGKLDIKCSMPLNNSEDLALAYTPGVAAPCKEIEKDPENAYVYTSKSHLVAVITDGSAVLGLGNIGGTAGMPVMEGKAALFKKFGGVDAFPICLATQNADEIVAAVKAIAPTFGGINLEDIASPKCFEVEERLKKELSIPVFHDDQHGTAVVVTAALFNALKLVKKDIGSVKIIVNGPGAAGTAIIKMLVNSGAKNIVVFDKDGALYRGKDGIFGHLEMLAEITNPDNEHGTLAESLKGADVFIGVSVSGVLNTDMVRTMAKDAIVFAMANPVPEISYDEAVGAGAAVVGTGRSDFPNQINNLLAFPGIFRGALDSGATEINEEMKLAAAKAIAEIIPENELRYDRIIPDPFDKRVAKRVAKAVAKAAEETGVTRK